MNDSPSFPPPPQDPATIRDWDRRASDDFSIPSIVLMENAGAGAARKLLELRDGYPRFRGALWIIACGPGNNGGDGFVVARYLAQAGDAVEIRLAFDPATFAPGADNTVNYTIARAIGIALVRADAPFPEPEERRAVIVDALFGTGLSRAPEPSIAALIEHIRACGQPVISLDVPSGLDAATGRALGAAVVADHTITFAAAKVGFALADGPAHVGELHVVDIGLPRALWTGGTPL